MYEAFHGEDHKEEGEEPFFHVPMSSNDPNQPWELVSVAVVFDSCSFFLLESKLGSISARVFSKQTGQIPCEKEARLCWET